MYSFIDYYYAIAELTPDGARLKVTFYNFEPKTGEFAVLDATFNDAPMLGPLPTVSVAPYASRVVYLSPIDPRVAEYGDSWSISYGSGSRSGSHGHNSPRLPYLQVSHTDESVTVSLATHGDAKPIEIRNPQVMVGKKVIAIVRGEHRLEPGKELTIHAGKPPPKGFKTVFAYRVTPWSAWKHLAY